MIWFFKIYYKLLLILKNLPIADNYLGALFLKTIVICQNYLII